jgi:hypothetical protein
MPGMDGGGKFFCGVFCMSCVANDTKTSGFYKLKQNCDLGYKSCGKKQHTPGI